MTERMAAATNRPWRVRSPGSVLKGIFGDRGVRLLFPIARAVGRA